MKLAVGCNRPSHTFKGGGLGATLGCCGHGGKLPDISKSGDPIPRQLVLRNISWPALHHPTPNMQVHGSS